MTKRNVFKNFIRYFNTLTDLELMELLQKLVSITLGGYRIVSRGKNVIVLSDNWDKIYVKDDCIILHNLNDPQVCEIQLRVFDCFFYISSKIHNRITRHDSNP